MPNLKVPGYVFYGSGFGLATLVVSDRFFMRKRSEGRCTTVLSGSVPVMAVCATDCDKDSDASGTFIKDITKVLWEGRRGGAKTSTSRVT